jgi:hypothetical protein
LARSALMPAQRMPLLFRLCEAVGLSINRPNQLRLPK